MDVSKIARSLWSGCSEFLPERPVLNQYSQRSGHCLRVVRLNQQSAGVVNYFPRSTDVRGYYRELSVERFNKGDSERFRPGIRLTKNISRRRSRQLFPALHRCSWLLPGVERRAREIIDDS